MVLQTTHLLSWGKWQEEVEEVILCPLEVNSQWPKDFPRGPISQGFQHLPAAAPELKQLPCGGQLSSKLQCHPGTNVILREPQRTPGEQDTCEKSNSDALKKKKTCINNQVSVMLAWEEYVDPWADKRPRAKSVYLVECFPTKVLRCSRAKAISLTVSRKQRAPCRRIKLAPYLTPRKTYWKLKYNIYNYKTHKRK